MKAATLGFVTALVILASAIAHAWIGWPAMESALAAQSVDADLIAALAAGWYFGSASMLAFAFIVGAQAQRRSMKLGVDVGGLICIAAVYLLFGIGAFVFRQYNPHFLLFVATGALVAAFAVSGRARLTR